jgi:hypothetical protein
MSALDTQIPPPGDPGVVAERALDAFQRAFDNLVSLGAKTRHDTFDGGCEHRLLLSLPAAVRPAIVAWEEDGDE